MGRPKVHLTEEARLAARRASSRAYAKRKHAKTILTPEMRAAKSAYDAVYNAANRERKSLQAREYREKNADAIREKKRASYRKNAEKLSAKSKAERAARIGYTVEQRATKRAWYARNKDAILPKKSELKRRRKARAGSATPAWANKFFMVEAYDLARRRTKATGFRWEVDHIVPLMNKRVCGLHCEQNLAVVPRAENRRKSNVQWPDMP